MNLNKLSESINIHIPVPGWAGVVATFLIGVLAGCGILYIKDKITGRSD